jgi:hypothetical protein
MRSRAIHTAGWNFPFHLKGFCNPATATRLNRCRYHLLRNVIPTLLMVVSLSLVTLTLSAWIDQARLNRDAASALSPQAVAGSVPGAAQLPASTR